MQARHQEASPPLQRQPSGVSRMLARLSPKGRLLAAAVQRQGPGQLAGQENLQPGGQAVQQQQQQHCSSDGGSGGRIPAFRPPSPPHGVSQLLTPGSDGGSPGKAQVQAVRALRHPGAQQQQQQRTPEGTPGLSEASSVGRAINAQIASSIADLFAATPQPEPRGGHSGAAAPAAEAPGLEPQWTAEPAWAPQLGAQQPAAAPPASPCGARMPVPPPVPLKLATAMRSDSGRLEPQGSPQVGWSGAAQTCWGGGALVARVPAALLQGGLTSPPRAACARRPSSAPCS